MSSASCVASSRTCDIQKIVPDSRELTVETMDLDLGP